MTSLSDTQAILLSTASQRESGSLLPLPACLKPGGGTAKAVAALVDRGFADERETSDAAAVRRSDGDFRYGLFITPAGLAAIGVEAIAVDDSATDAPQAVAPARTSKTSLVLDLLRRPDGATLSELIEATGWLPHTTRAALTGIRKKGHAVTRGPVPAVITYSPLPPLLVLTITGLYMFARHARTKLRAAMLQAKG